jgi:hypothetical protein
MAPRITYSPTGARRNMHANHGNPAYGGALESVEDELGLRVFGSSRRRSPEKQRTIR